MRTTLENEVNNAQEIDTETDANRAETAEAEGHTRVEQKHAELVHP